MTSDYPWELAYLGLGLLVVGLVITVARARRRARALSPAPRRDPPKLRLVPPLPEPPQVIDAAAWLRSHR